jgi:hypothetical protein
MSVWTYGVPASPADKPRVWLGGKVRITAKTPTPEARPEVDIRNKKRLEAKGWVVGDAGEFLRLTAEEARYIELKLSLSESLKAERLKRQVTQVELAKMIGSSQSRVAKMEAGDPAVTVDLLLKALLTLGVTKKQLAKIIA